MILLNIEPFDKGCFKDKAIKILEEASEVRAALQYEGINSSNLLYEICDVITASVNMASSLGYTNNEIQAMLNKVQKHNEKRGYYND